jgi:hypothetical protein
MKSAVLYYGGLALFCVLVLAFWLGGLSALGHWLWNLLHGISPV